MNTTTNTTADRTVSPSLAAQYRQDPPTIEDTLVGLASFLTHRAIYCAGGHRDWVAITERSWWQDAICLAAMPAWSAAEARAKVVALQPALDGRATNIAGDGHRGHVAMIAAGVATERSRWAIDNGVKESSIDRTGWEWERTMNDAGVTFIGFAPWQLALYDAMRKPRTLRDSTRSLVRFATHEAELRAAGDLGAATGATIHLRNALIGVASIEVANVPALLEKAGRLGEHRAVWAGDPLATAMVDAAIAADGIALKPRSRECDRIERLLKGLVR